MEVIMKMRKMVLSTILSGLLFALAPVYGQMNGGPGVNFRGILDAGISTPIDNQSGDWGLGFSIGGSAFYIINDNFLFGPRVQFDRWGPDEDGILGLAGISTGVVDGSYWTLQIVPTLRLTTNYDFGFFNIFGQGGLGLAIIRRDATVETPNLRQETTVVDISQERLALNLGAGATFGDVQSFAVEILPIVSMIFLENRTDYNLSVNAGISYAFGW